MTKITEELWDVPDWVPMAIDTETNGLWADSGARLSIISNAWMDPEILVSGDQARIMHAIETGEGVHSRAYPFSQGAWDKPGAQVDLFAGDDPNLGEDDWYDLLGHILGRRLVMHHLKFDCEKLRYGPITHPDWIGADLVDQVVWDTQVSAPDLWLGETSSLKPTMARLFGDDETKAKDALTPYLGPKDNPRYDLVPWDVISTYAAKDAEQTIRLYYYQLIELGLLWEDDDPDLRRAKICRREIETAKCLYRMERAGIPYDAEGSLEAAAVLKKRHRELAKQLPFKATSPAAIKYFFGPTGQGGLGLLPYSVTEKGSPQFTAMVVTRIIHDYGPDEQPGKIARIWSELAKLKTAISMWYEPYANGLGSDGRLRTCYRQTSRGKGDEDGGTRSGRFSVERVNLQAIPHDYRLAVGEERTWTVPTPRQLIGKAARDLEGWKLWEFDLAQAELRVAAAWAKCEPMVDALNNDEDLHGQTATELFNVVKGDMRWDFYRQVGKRANFSCVFGVGGTTFATAVTKETGEPMTVDQGDVITRDWNRLRPEFGRTIERWSRYVDGGGIIALASDQGYGTGRLNKIPPFEDTHKAFNRLVQGSIAEFARDWNLQTERLLAAEGLGLKPEPGVGWTGMLAVIHDSQVMLLPDGDRGAEIADKVVAATEKLWGRYFAREGLGVLPVKGGAEGKLWG